MERARVALPSVVKISFQLAQQRRVIGRTDPITHTTFVPPVSIPAYSG